MKKHLAAILFGLVLLNFLVGCEFEFSIGEKTEKEDASEKENTSEEKAGEYFLFAIR
jgi:hypothetical protein